MYNRKPSLYFALRRNQILIDQLFNKWKSIHELKKKNYPHYRLSNIAKKSMIGTLNDGLICHNKKFHNIHNLKRISNKLIKLSNHNNFYIDKKNCFVCRKINEYKVLIITDFCGVIYFY